MVTTGWVLTELADGWAKPTQRKFLVPMLTKLRANYEQALEDKADSAAAMKKQIGELQSKQNILVGDVQLWQELGGLAGRFALAYLALRIVSRRGLLRVFQLPGLFIVPLVFAFPAAGQLPADNLFWLKVGIFAAGFCTVAQFSFWGNYVPRVYPVHLRGTGEGFAANVGGRMLGTFFNPLTTALAPVILTRFDGTPRTTALAWAASGVALLVFSLGSVLTFFLPEPGDATAE